VADQASRGAQRSGKAGDAVLGCPVGVDRPSVEGIPVPGTASAALPLAAGDEFHSVSMQRPPTAR
jgi:hypothetical protein